MACGKRGNLEESKLLSHSSSNPTHRAPTSRKPEQPSRVRRDSPSPALTHTRLFNLRASGSLIPQTTLAPRTCWLDPGSWVPETPLNKATSIPTPFPCSLPENNGCSTSSHTRNMTVPQSDWLRL